MRPTALFLAVLTLLCGPVQPLTAQATARIIAIGDIHGSIDGIKSILKVTGLIDGTNKWSGGRTQLLQTGDYMDRGEHTRAVLDLLMALESQAKDAGGRAFALLGNHEVMNLLGVTRDVSPAAFASFVDTRSAARRENAFTAAEKIRGSGADDRTAWMDAHPLGLVEYREAFKPDGRYGRWLRSKKIVAEIDGTVFLHGGINLAFTTDSLDDINARARREIAQWDDAVKLLEGRKLVLPFSTLPEVIAAADAELTRLEAAHKKRELSADEIRTASLLLSAANIDTSSLLHADGPLWFRGYSTWTDDEGTPLMAALLRKYRARRFVTGHTVQQTGRITRRFNDALFLIDTGMLDGRFYPRGRASALEITGEAVKTVYGDAAEPVSRVGVRPRFGSASGRPRLRIGWTAQR